MFGEGPETEAYDDAVSQIASSIQNLKDQYDELSKKMPLKDESDFYPRSVRVCCLWMRAGRVYLQLLGVDSFFPLYMRQ